MVRVANRDGSIRTGRPLLRTFMGLTIVAFGAGCAWISFSNSVGFADRFRPGDWWWLIVFFAVAGAGYSYVASTLEVTPTLVVIQNPLRRIVIPIGHVTSVRQGSNLRVDTEYAHAYAWGVEAANVDLVADRLTKQEGLAEIILARAGLRRDADKSFPPAHYRWTLPPPFLLLVAPIYVALSIAIAIGWHPAG